MFDIPTFILIYFRLRVNNLFQVIYNNIGDIMYKRLRDLREDSDLNQTEMAKILGTSQTCYSKYETGENDVPTEILIKLADFYKVSVDYILNRTSKKEMNK